MKIQPYNNITIFLYLIEINIAEKSLKISIQIYKKDESIMPFLIEQKIYLKLGKIKSKE